jgi:hypothetical protein
MNGRIKVCFAICLIFALLVSGSPIFGQEAGSRANEKGAVGYFTGGVGWILESGSSSIVCSLGGGAMTSDVSSTVSKCALLNPAVGLDFLIPVKNESGILVGLRAGYTFTVYSNTFSWSMPHIRLLVGGYGFGE